MGNELMKSSETDAQPGNSSVQRRVLVIGFGSPIRGDDALGPLVADQLMGELDHPQVEIQSRHILTAELAELLEQASLVVFLDAAVDTPAGEVRTRPLDPNADQVDSMAHSLGPRELLAWTRGLYGYCPPAILLTAGAESLDYAAYQLTPAAAAAVPVMVEHVKQIVGDHFATHPTSC
jgi:hydrogenase maturation protease